MYELKKIPAGPPMRILSVIFAFAYAIFAIWTIVNEKSSNIDLTTRILAALLGMIMVALVGAVIGVIVAVLYNFIAKKSGGIKLDFELVEEDEFFETHEDSDSKTNNKDDDKEKDYL
jgi:hypothetical protein